MKFLISPISLIIVIAVISPIPGIVFNNSISLTILCGKYGADSKFLISDNIISICDSKLLIILISDINFAKREGWQIPIILASFAAWISLEYLSSAYLIPFPLYGSGNLYSLMFAATWPTNCLSIPFTIIEFCEIIIHYVT